MNNLRPARYSCLAALVLCLAALLGCGNGSKDASAPVVISGSYHPADWVNNHGGKAEAGVAACTTCHEIAVPKAGSGAPTCMTAACHHQTVPGWANPGSHGLRAKLAVSTNGGSLVSCQICHGSDFSGGLSATACVTCHGVKAPHSAKPWRTSAGSPLTHTTTDPSNAAVCVQCHYPGSANNPAGHPAVPAPAGTQPGCYNATLCHGPAAAPHALGAIWKDPTSAAFHGLEAKKDLKYCQSCHGTPGTALFDGGAAATACSSCHVKATGAAAHPTTWYLPASATFPGYVASHRNAADPLNPAGSCVICHAVTKTGTSALAAAPSCYSASSGNAEHAAVSCHANGPAAASHAIPYLDATHTAVTQAAFNANCATCHAVSGTSPTSAPLCTACHQAGSPLTLSNCSSCHAKPPTGSAFPNLAGVHAKHDALATVTGACGSCHQGSDTGSLAHYNAANGRSGHDANRVPPGQVAFLSAFNAASGLATFNATSQTCSNVSCHGGQVTPGWATGGTINVATDCTKCHSVGTAPGVPQANSATSGFHALHMTSTAGLLCTECHAMSNGSTGALAHFTTLNTAAMEGAASTTVAFTGGTYTAGAKTCTVTCHGETHASYTWSGNGGVHPAGWVTSHPGSALAGVNACKTCHGVNLQGGPYKEPSCNTAACHHNTLPGYALAGNHGLRAKLAQGATGGGLASCQTCHGSNFASGLIASDGTTKACTTCHGVAAPHPAKPWHNAAGSNHATTDVSNAPVCVQCHFPGSTSNPAGHPASPAPAGTAPGCFNNTLCHGSEAAPHALGVIWTDATSLAFHGFQAKKDLASCQTCHGTPGTTSFAGGAAASTKCTTCHTQGKAHANVWNAAPVATFPGYVASHRDAGNRSVACAICHDGTKGRTAPDPTAPSCFSATANSVACHVNGPGQPNHPVPFLTTTHTTVTQVGFDANCGVCHAVTGTSPSVSAPVCNACHQAGSPFTQTNCTSCHAKPPSAGTFPNVAGSHAKHDALANLTGICAACHQAADSGTQIHYDHADGRPGHDSLRVAPGVVATDPTYSAKSGAALFNATQFTCSNISCHGGQTTPSWLNGTLATNTEAGCRACHALGTAQGLPENNSPYSGLHALHLNSTQGLQCVECHNMANGTTGALNHFKSLNTAAMEGPAGQTVAFSTATPAATYDIASQSCGSGGAFSCHGHAHSATYTWKGGGSHAVPYTGTAHTSVNNQTSFTSSCGNCHAVTGSSPNSSAPLCTTCHQAGSPLIQANCTSCHNKPPVGTVFPDVAGTHAKHNALTGFTAQCSTCHTNADTGTQLHYDHANARPGKDALRVAPGETAFLASVSGKSGAASFDSVAMTCSNISCHGGLATPSWRTGTIAVNTEAGCRACHSAGTAAGLPESNSAYSGLHTFHLGGTVNAQCVDCHNMANGSTGALNHFTSLATTQMEGPASGTIALAGGTYTAATQACTVTCHSMAHSGFLWTGGANHSVPFATSAHTAVNQAGFDSNCATCHAATGSVSPMAAAPTCVTCHQAGSPLTLANCSSCHAKPPTGSAFPNVAGTHSIHNALTGVANVCASCHTGSESGSTTHYDHANGRPGLNGLRVAPGQVAFPATTYNAKTGAASFNATAQTCSNVSCHGGQTTPVWTNTASIATQCTACHASGTAQYNSYNSGKHGFHLAGLAGGNAACSDCHQMSNGSAGANNHFKALGTSAMEGPAKDTVTFDPAVVSGARVYTVSGTNKTCAITCHGQTHDAGKTW